MKNDDDFFCRYVDARPEQQPGPALLCGLSYNPDASWGPEPDSRSKSGACGEKCRDKAHAPSQCLLCHNVPALIKHMELRHEDSDPEGMDITTSPRQDRRQSGTSAITTTPPAAAYRSFQGPYTFDATTEQSRLGKYIHLY